MNNIEMEICWQCNGRGQVPINSDPFHEPSGYEQCPQCHGTGELPKKE